MDACCMQATYSLAEINSYLIKDLIDNLLALFLVFQACHVVDGVVHHFLSLIHDVVLALEFHGYPLQRR